MQNYRVLLSTNTTEGFYCEALRGITAQDYQGAIEAALDKSEKLTPRTPTGPTTALVEPEGGPDMFMEILTSIITASKLYGLDRVTTLCVLLGDPNRPPLAGEILKQIKPIREVQSD